MQKAEQADHEPQTMDDELLTTKDTAQQRHNQRKADHDHVYVHVDVNVNAGVDGNVIGLSS
jgi:hypothetical protein